MKVCGKCKIEKTEDSFNFRNVALGKRHAHCKECQREYKRKHYESDKERYKSRALISNRLIKARNRDFIFEIKCRSECVDCGNDDPHVLDFDHLNDKVKAISRLVSDQSSIEVLEQELLKCEVVCANCHRIRTAKRGGWYKEYTRV